MRPGETLLRMLGIEAKGRGFLDASSKADPAGTLISEAMPGGGRVELTGDGSFEGLVRKGFEDNTLVYAGVMEIANAVPQAPLVILDEKDAPIADHPTALLVKRPNPFMSGVLFWKVTILHLYLSGNAWWEKVRGPDGKVVQLWPLRPDRMSVVRDKKKFILGWAYRIGMNETFLPVEDVVHFKFPHPTDAYFGMSPLRAACKELETDNEATNFVYFTLKNLGVPGVVVKTQEQRLTRDSTDLMSALWMERFSGRERGKPVFLQKGMEVEVVSYDFQKLGFTGVRSGLEARVLMAVQVPPILVGAGATRDGGPTYANYNEARTSFWEETVASQHSMLSGTISMDRDLVENPLFEAGFDTTRVPALQKQRNEKWETHGKAWDRGLLRRDEARSGMGLPAIGGSEGEQFKPAAGGIFGGEPPPDGEDDPLSATEDEARRAEGQQAAKTKAALAALRARPPIEEKADDETPERRWAANRLPEFEGEMLAIFGHQASDVLKVLEVEIRKAAEKGVLTQEVFQRLVNETLGKRTAWELHAQDQIAKEMIELVGGSAKRTGLRLGISFEIGNEEAISFLQRYTFKFARRISDTSVEDVRQVLLDAFEHSKNMAETRDMLLQKFTTWSESRATMVARTEIIRGLNEGSLLAYKKAGFRSKKWKATGGACPVCRALDGKIISIDQDFVPINTTWDPTDENGAKLLPAPFKPTYESVGRPPAHPNCRCAIIGEHAT